MRIAKYLAFSEQYLPIQQNILNCDPTPSSRSLKSVEQTFHWCLWVLTSFGFWREVCPPCAVRVSRHPRLTAFFRGELADVEQANIAADVDRIVLEDDFEQWGNEARILG